MRRSNQEQKERSMNEEKWKRENETHLIRKKDTTLLTLYMRGLHPRLARERCHCARIQSRTVSGTSVVIYGMLIATLRYVPHLSGNCMTT
jgi:hypothetical protein